MTDYLTVDGVRLEYAWHGPGPQDAPTLVLLHEGLGCVELWRDVPQQLADMTGLGVLVYSRQGYGASDPIGLPRPVTFMHREGLEVLPGVLDAADICRAVLVGHSDGGSIALIHAGGVGDPRVEGVVTLAAHVFNEELSVESIAAAKVAFETTDLRARLERYHGANVDVAFRGWNDVWLHPDFWHWNIGEYLPGISVPLLAIQGEEDQYGTPAQVEAIARQVSGPVETLMVPGAKHSPHLQRQDVVLPAIADFARKVTGT